jgi:hypothetical protein
MLSIYKYISYTYIAYINITKLSDVFSYSEINLPIGDQILNTDQQQQICSRVTVNFIQCNIQVYKLKFCALAAFHYVIYLYMNTCKINIIHRSCSVLNLEYYMI